MFEEFRADLEKVKEYIPSYKVEDNEDCEWDDEDLWLTQSQLAEIYDTTKQNISQHIENILNDGELDINRTVKEFLTVRQEGNRYKQKKGSCQKTRTFFSVHPTIEILNLWEDFKKVVEFIEDNSVWLKPMMERITNKRLL